MSTHDIAGGELGMIEPAGVDPQDVLSGSYDQQFRELLGRVPPVTVIELAQLANLGPLEVGDTIVVTTAINCPTCRGRRVVRELIPEHTRGAITPSNGYRIVDCPTCDGNGSVYR